MGETEKTKAQKESWIDGLKNEFGKIAWLNKKTLGRQATAVVIVSVIVGFIIAILDTVIQYGVDFLTGIGV